MRTAFERDEDTSQVRREEIRELIRNERIGTQEELREFLVKKGFEVTQATLSRDLAKIKARRVTLPEGGSIYELEDAPVIIEDNELRTLGEMVTSVNEGDSLVVIQTRIGAASAVALGIDRARFTEILGTIAGDDTIFIAPRKRISGGKLKKILEDAFGIESSVTNIRRLRRR